MARKGPFMIELNDLLEKVGLDPKLGMVMRHRPKEPTFRKALCSLAAEEPAIYNAYQSCHHEAAERALGRAAFLVSFVGHEPGKAIFVGIYHVDGWCNITGKKWAALETSRRLVGLGVQGPEHDRRLRLFNLVRTEELAAWRGRLLVNWPPPERSWWRWAGRNLIKVDSIHPESILVEDVPDPNELVLTWEELQSLPRSWQHAMAQWRGIYLILDRASGKGYVGSAYGHDNLLARWRSYARTGHGSNVDLKGRDPRKFTFAILQLVAQDLPPEKVVHLESSWKKRLGTREFGLNGN